MFHMIVLVDRDCFPVRNSLTGLSIHIQLPYSFDLAFNNDIQQLTSFKIIQYSNKKIKFLYDLTGHPLLHSTLLSPS